MYQKIKKRILMFLAACLLLTALPFGNFYSMPLSAKTGISVQMQIGKKKVTKKTFQMKEGASRQLKVKALENKKSIRIRSVQYRSSNKKIASVTKNGVIRAKTSGTAKITVSVKTNRGNRTEWMKVKVNAVQQDQESGETPQQPGGTPQQPGETPQQPGETPQQPGGTPQPEPVPEPSLPDESGEKILIAYFTRSGNTEKLANMIADKTGGTKFRIETETAYPQDYSAALEQASKEREQNARPLLKGRVENMSDYGTVFLGYPIWFGDTPMAIHSFLESYDFTGKKIIPFCTSGSSSPQTSYESVRVSVTGAEALEGFWIQGTSAGNAQHDVSRWIDRLGITGENQSQSTSGNEEGKVKITAGNTVFYAELEDNSSAQVFRKMLLEGPVTVQMNDYGDMEKVGPLGKSLPTNDENITTGPGDLILYQGNSLVIYYDTNTWNFTRLGKIDGVTKQELLAAFGNGDVTVTLSLS